MTGILKLFFAVTMSGSLYRVSCNKNGFALAKLLLIGHSKIPQGSVLKSDSTAECLGIVDGEGGLVRYLPEHSRGGKPYPAELTNTGYWAGWTSGIVALFLDKQSALACARKSQLNFLDERWSGQTLDVIKRIGDDHPFFIPSNGFLKKAAIPFDDNPARH